MRRALHEDVEEQMATRTDAGGRGGGGKSAMKHRASSGNEVGRAVRQIDCGGRGWGGRRTEEWRSFGVSARGTSPCTGGGAVYGVSGM